MTHPQPSAAQAIDELLREPASRALLHICNGHATSKPLGGAALPGTFQLFVDVLLEGPCPPLWGEQWRKLRMKFLIDCGYAAAPEQGDELEASAPEEPEEPEEPAIIWDDDFERALSSPGQLDEIVLWYEHDLFDQLLLVRLLALVARHAGERPRLSLVCIGEHPAVPAFRGLGQLNPDQLASLFETRSSIDETSIALGRDAWAAYADPDPRNLEALLERDLSALPFLARALRRHLEEYPGIADGLSRTERNLLTLVRDGVVDPPRAFWQLIRAEDCHYLGDSWFVRLVQRLTAPPAPLLTLAGTLRLPLSAGQATLALTPLGDRVVRGQVDWLSLAGIDRWLGGVHLTDAQTGWRWDPTSRRLCRRERQQGSG